MIWTMWAKTSITTLFSKCWAIGPSAIISRLAGFIVTSKERVLNRLVSEGNLHLGLPAADGSV